MSKLSEEITLTIKGKAGNRDFLVDVVRQLDAMKKLMLELADTVGKAKVEVLSISKNSPLMVRIRVVDEQKVVRKSKAKSTKTEVVYKAQTRPVARLVKTIESATSPKQSLKDVDDLISLRDFASNLRDDEATIATSTRTFTVTKSLIDQIDGKIKTSLKSSGALVGRIETINIHSNPHTFTLYREILPYKVICRFKLEDYPELTQLIGCHVTVHGLKEYVAGSPHPVKMDVRDVELLRPATRGDWSAFRDTLRNADFSGYEPFDVGGMPA